MAPFRGGGGRGRGGVRGKGGGGARGNSRGGARGNSRGGGKVARSGIRTPNGYKRFDSQRVRDIDQSDSDDVRPQPAEDEIETKDEQSDDNEEATETEPAVRSYHALLQSLHQPSDDPEERTAKRRKIEKGASIVDHNLVEDSEPTGADLTAVLEVADQDDGHEEPSEEAENDGDSSNDPYRIHFADPDENELSRRLKSVQAADWKSERQSIGKSMGLSLSAPSCIKTTSLRNPILDIFKVSLKERLIGNAAKHVPLKSELQQGLAPYVLNYTDLLIGNRATKNAPGLRNLAALHAVNHVLKGRDRVLKNNERIKHTEEGVELELRDQGFVRPKVLILTETRHMAANFADSIVDMFQPEQQENKQRFTEAFRDPIDERDTMPEDHRELFEGNNDNNFMTALKFTRKTLRFFSAFYNSDIVLASPLGLRRIIENEDVKKRDYDFLSSIEVAIIDQADAMQMQNWENVEVVFKHLNLQLKEQHGCDFSRVRPWYLDGNTKYLRQTIVFSAYITPEMNRLFNTSMLNVAGKAKLTPVYAGAITETSGLGVKQTFSRFASFSPTDDPDARFKYFTTAVLPSLLRLPKPTDGAQGILIFIPSYFDFLRLRNHFAASTQTENVSFGAIHDYTEIPAQRRARSHFLSGRHSILLYTQRAHHFFRLKIRGVKKVVMYGLPDNPVFYQEMVDGFLGMSVDEGKVDPVEAGVRGVFSKWDGLRLERVVGSERVKGMLGGVGDTFEFV